VLRNWWRKLETCVPLSPERNNPQVNNLRYIKMRSFILFIALVIACSLAGLAAPAQSDTVKSAGPAEIQQVDLEGLKKLLQRDPKDTRPLLVNFWATWCDPCREEFPDLVKIDEDYRSKGLNFVAVSLDDVGDIKTKVEPFLKEMKATMPVVLLNVNDPEPAIHAVDPSWQGDMPATFLYDKEGKVAFKHFGPIKASELRAAIDKLTPGNK
jgi:thiol-disulfide isomerase/thioredoxin